MGAAKYFLLPLFIFSLLQTSQSYVGRCTQRTAWQIPFNEELFKDSGLTLDCDCIERADLFASAKVLGGVTENYNDIYAIFTSYIHGLPLRHDSEQFKCMLNELYMERNDQLSRAMRIFKGNHYGCSYGKNPSGETSGNASIAVTCIIKKAGGRCR
ncbi:hypothetical protein Q1695_015906 [Nippostrongylus brasiliensis]|nr:hypothetical protein Q1695_015906 [Nippostrongylus brasiliensis]